MAESGDPPPHDDHDDLIGFTSAASLTGARRVPKPEPAPLIPSGPAWDQDDPEQGGLFDPPVNRVAALRTPSRVEPSPAPPVSAWPGDDGASIPSTAPLSSNLSSNQAPAEGFGRAPAVKPPRIEGAEGAMGLFSVYVLILSAVPTLGLAAAIALIAVTVRPRPDQPLARSHFDFQKRTLWIAAVIAVLGVALIAVNLGVFVLFVLAVWMVLRGAWGLMLLARGDAIKRPHQWLIAAR